MKHNTCIACLITLCAICTNMVANAQGKKGEKTIGLQAGYTTINTSAIAGIEFTYRFSNHFRLAPNVSYAFKHNQMDALVININAQVPFSMAPKWEIFPLAGFNYSSWNFHHNGTANDDSDVTTRDSRLGINLGAGISVAATSTLRLSLTADYVFVKHFNGCNIAAKIAYCF